MKYFLCMCFLFVSYFSMPEGPFYRRVVAVVFAGLAYGVLSGWDGEKDEG